MRKLYALMSYDTDGPVKMHSVGSAEEMRELMRELYRKDKLLSDTEAVIFGYDNAPCYAGKFSAQVVLSGGLKYRNYEIVHAEGGTFPIRNHREWQRG